MADLSRKRERERLKVRRDTYTMRLAEGAYLGFRRGPDTWLARFRDGDGKQHYRALNVASDDYDTAKKAAEEWFAQLGGTAVRAPKRTTVADALETYLTDLERHGRTDAARTARSLFKTVLKDDDPLPALPLETARRDDFEEWRDRLRPGRQARSVNRYVNQVTAALHRAHELGHVGNPSAWSLKPLVDETEEEGTAIFLDGAQRAALIKAADGYAGQFFRGLELTGARPSELAGATVGDFDGKRIRLSHRKGKGSKLRVRYTVLDQDGVEFFTACAAGKLPAVPIFTEDGAQPWRRHIWAECMRDAATEVNKNARGAARIPEGVGAYAFRHARISELLQIYQVDPLTVGQQTGTSLAMIEKAYMRFIPTALQDKLANIKAQ